MTPTEFVTARLDEWEQAILNGWDSNGSARVASMWTGGDPGYTTVASDHGDGEWVADGREVTDARHVQVLFDPARVLAQVAAMRAIVELHVELRKHVKAAGRAYSDWIEGRQVPPDAPNLRDGCEPRILEAQERWLRHLAAIWRDHPDYDPAWAPD